MTDPLPASPGSVADKSADFTWDGQALEPGRALALSGGGFRAMLFHAGALMRLNELGLLSTVARISSVSGGSIASGYLAGVWQQLGAADGAGSYAQFKEKYVEPILAFSRQKIDVGDILTGLLPWTSAADQVKDSYDKALFHGITLQALPDTPQFIFCATNLQTGVNFRFSKPYAGDYVVGRLANPDLPLSTAVTASSAFPPFLSPLVLTLPAGSFTDWPGQAAGAGGVVDPAPFRSKVFLTDGGVYDNHGLEPIVKRYMTLLVSDGGAPFARTADVATESKAFAKFSSAGVSSDCNLSLTAIMLFAMPIDIRLKANSGLTYLLCSRPFSKVYTVRNGSLIMRAQAVNSKSLTLGYLSYHLTLVSLHSVDQAIVSVWMMLLDN